MKKNYFTYFVISLITISCQSALNKKTPSKSTIEVQGHRGDRGNFPENTIQAFKSAIAKGVDVIELDVVISADQKVVVSHEPYMSSLYVLTPKKEEIQKLDKKKYNLFQMTYDSIKRYETGLKPNPNFPKQKHSSAYKPLLAEVIDSVENWISKNKRKKVSYNIEIKSNVEEYEIFQPKPEKFISLVMQVLNQKKINRRFTIQSFDPNVLNQLHESFPKVKLAYLVSKGTVESNLKKLHFIPEIYSPIYSLLNDSKTIFDIKSKGMKIIPWTVNDPENIQKMIDLKVNGIISDYPELALKMLERSH